MKFVTSLAFTSASDLGPLAQAADRAGFAYVSISDHVIHPKKLETPYPYTDDGSPRWKPFTSWPDPWVTIASLAAQTERLRFYTSVYVLPMRDPFSVAKMVGTASVLSQGRVSLGAGVGWMKDEFDLIGRDFRNRGKRMNEMIPVMRRIWEGGWVEYHGEFYDFAPLEMSPVPSEPIPIYTGGFSQAALRRAAQLSDGWIADLHTTDEITELIAKVRQLRAESDRAKDPFKIFGSVMDTAGLDGYRRLQDIGITHLVTFPWVFYHGLTDSLDEKIDGIKRFGDEIISQFE